MEAGFAGPGSIGPKGRRIGLAAVSKRRHVAGRVSPMAASQSRDRHRVPWAVGLPAQEAAVKWNQRTRETFESNRIGASVAIALLLVMVGVVIYGAGWMP